MVTWPNRIWWSTPNRLATVKLRAKALLFDSDGTLLDAFESANRCWDDWADKMGVEKPVLRPETHGRPRSTVVKMVLPGVSDEEAELHAEEVRLAELHDTRGVIALPGTFDVLSSLPPDAWAVVTSADRDVAEARLAAAGLPVPKVLIPSDELEHGKPHPMGYLLACERLNVRPEDAIVFEDAPAGLEAAKRGGIRAIAGRHTADHDDQLRESIAIIDDLAQISVEVDGSELVLHLPAY